MSVPRPKILTCVTVPAGGWALKLYLTTTTQYDTPVAVTIPAGDYFVADDRQTDDLIGVIEDTMHDAIFALGGAHGAGATSFWCDVHPAAHKVRMQLAGATDGARNDVKLAWTESASGLCAAIGVDGTTDDTSTVADDPTFTADWHHAYGWYSDEDGQLADLLICDTSVEVISQGVALTGETKTQYYGGRGTNRIALQFLERSLNGRSKVFSGGVGYGAAPVHPYNRNEPLQCWWTEARQGKRFRVYRDANRDTARAADRGVVTADAATTITDSAKAWATEPQRWKNLIAHSSSVSPAGTRDISRSFFVAANTATALTVTTSSLGTIQTGDTYYLFNHQYGTYVLDSERMSSFAPTEIDRIDRFGMDIPLLVYA